MDMTTLLNIRLASLIVGKIGMLQIININSSSNNSNNRNIMANKELFIVTTLC